MTRNFPYYNGQIGYNNFTNYNKFNYNKYYNRRKNTFNNEYVQSQKSLGTSQLHDSQNNCNHDSPKHNNKCNSFNSSNNTCNKTEILVNEHPEFLDIFGIKLFYDDILLISLIFFLYNEGVKDQYLFISLILLLLS